MFGIGAAVAMAWLWPEGGRKGGALYPGAVQTAGVFLIFFSHGLSLPFESVRRGLADWRLHLCVQSSVYAVLPLLAAIVVLLASPWLSHPDLRAGFLLLGALPTTISSAVALTSATEGNVSGAVFNTTVSNVAGVVIVPAVAVAMFAGGGGAEAPPVAPLLGDVAATIVLPMALGQAWRPALRRWVDRRKAAVRRLNAGVIYFIVYAAFCESVSRDVWSSVAAGELIAAVAGALALLLAASAAVWAYAGALGLDAPSRNAALFCGSQKTLAAGLPLAAAILGALENGPDLSLALIPLLCYHPAQLALAGALAPRLRSRRAAAD